MISGLIDELRKSADEWNGSNMFELARMCSEAADTIWQLRDDLQRANAAVQDAEHDESMAWDRVRKAEAENAKLREQMERLVTLLRVDCDIEASWDGLRKFWSIELTDGGCLMRDRVCKGEAENAKLRELVEDMLSCIEIRAAFGRPPTDEMYETFAQRARELGMEVDG